MSAITAENSPNIPKSISQPTKNKLSNLQERQAPQLEKRSPNGVPQSYVGGGQSVVEQQRTPLSQTRTDLPSTTGSQYPPRATPTTGDHIVSSLSSNLSNSNSHTSSQVGAPPYAVDNLLVEFYQQKSADAQKVAEKQPPKTPSASSSSLNRNKPVQSPSQNGMSPTSASFGTQSANVENSPVGQPKPSHQNGHAQNSTISNNQYRTENQGNSMNNTGRGSTSNGVQQIPSSNNFNPNSIETQPNLWMDQFNQRSHFQNHSVQSAAPNSSTPSSHQSQQETQNQLNYHQSNYNSNSYQQQQQQQAMRKRKRQDTSSYDVHYIDEDASLYDGEATRRVQMKLEEARQQIDELQYGKEAYNAELFTLFSDLQGISADFGVRFNAPEVVVVGMQSDGKSSFIEGLLGFQFNIVDTGIGTRRPLIIQMLNDPSKSVPSCRFRKEDSATLTAEEDAFESRETPVNELSSEITRRTNNKAGTSKDRVSDVPIILRVQYMHCANLTIFDTPGFRLSGSESLRNDILDMVMRIAAPRHRIIVCLDQSTVEWTNSNSRPIIQRIDPEFQRTVLVNTKFDNRVKELLTSESADKYMAGEALPEGKKPFFISMPIRRDLQADQFKKAMKQCYLQDLEALLQAGFDESRFGNQLGIFNLKTHLERLVYKKYLECISPTLFTLDALIEKTLAEIKDVERELQEKDIEMHRRRVWSFVQVFSSRVDELLHGSIVGNPEVYGQTLYQEKMSSNLNSWPNSTGRSHELHNSSHHDRIHESNRNSRIPLLNNGVEANSRISHQNLVQQDENDQSTLDPALDASIMPDVDNRMIVHEDQEDSQPNTQSRFSPSSLALDDCLQLDVPNANLSLYGGSQFNRFMFEFEYVIHATDIPKASMNEVASALGLNKNSTINHITDAASDIACSKATSALIPLIKVALRRSHFIFTRIFDIAYSVAIGEHSSPVEQMASNRSMSRAMSNSSDFVGISVLSQYPQFLKEIKSVYESFLNSLIDRCERALHDDIAKLTSVIDWSLISGVQELVPHSVQSTESQFIERNSSQHQNDIEESHFRTRASKIMSASAEGPSLLGLSLSNHSTSFMSNFFGNQITQERYNSVSLLSSKLFAGIRFWFAKMARADLNTFLLKPMFNQMLPQLMSHFNTMSSASFEALFDLGAAAMREKHASLQIQLKKLQESRDRFESLFNKVRETTS